MPTEALFCHFRGLFLWQVFPLTNFLVFSLDGTGVDLSGGGRGPGSWSGIADPLAPRSLPSLFSALPDLPALLTTPQLSRTPRRGAPYVPRWDPTTLVPGMGFAPASQKTGLPALRGGPSPPSPTLKDHRGGESSRFGIHSSLPACVPSHTVILLSCPRTAAWARSSPGSIAWVKCSPFLLLGTAAGRRGTGCSLPQPSPFLLPPGPRRPAWLLHREPAPLSSGLGGPSPLLPMGRCLRPPTAAPPRPKAKWTGTVQSHRTFCISRTLSVGEGARLSVTG